jgi:TldD protein
MKLVENAKKTAQEAVMLAGAEECPSGEYDVIIDPDQLSIQIHESIGHALELDRILGMEAAFAGKSFITTEDIKMDIIYGSENVNVVLDSGISSGLGTFGYDDDGIKAQRAVLIQNGVLKNVLTSRETASHIAGVSNGTSIAEGWGYVPITRITNVNLMPGDMEFDELVSGISKGFYLCTNKSWSIDDKRMNFQFGCEIAYEIENGRLTGKIYKNPVYSGSTLDFWRKCDGICSEKYWRIYGVPNCVKGQPSQIAQVAHGSSPARFRNIRVGVKND